jgi:hypothetical protein
VYYGTGNPSVWNPDVRPAIMYKDVAIYAID